jgi:hypothetical protein
MGAHERQTNRSAQNLRIPPFKPQCGASGETPDGPMNDHGYRAGLCRHWIMVKNPESPAMKRAAKVDWSR